MDDRELFRERLRVTVGAGKGRLPAHDRALHYFLSSPRYPPHPPSCLATIHQNRYPAVELRSGRFHAGHVWQPTGSGQDESEETGELG